MEPQMTEAEHDAMRAAEIHPELQKTEPEVTAAELDLIREELDGGLPIPDIYEPADVAIWRAAHAAELQELPSEPEPEAEYEWEPGL